jgi:hypothetical protein
MTKLMNEIKMNLLNTGWKGAIDDLSIKAMASEHYNKYLKKKLFAKLLDEQNECSNCHQNVAKKNHMIVHMCSKCYSKYINER